MNPTQPSQHSTNPSSPEPDTHRDLLNPHQVITRHREARNKFDIYIGKIAQNPEYGTYRVKYATSLIEQALSQDEIASTQMASLRTALTDTPGSKDSNSKDRFDRALQHYDQVVKIVDGYISRLERREEQSTFKLNMVTSNIKVALEKYRSETNHSKLEEEAIEINAAECYIGRLLRTGGPALSPFVKQELQDARDYIDRAARGKQPGSLIGGAQAELRRLLQQQSSQFPALPSTIARKENEGQGEEMNMSATMFSESDEEEEVVDVPQKADKETMEKRKVKVGRKGRGLSGDGQKESAGSST